MASLPPFALVEDLDARTPGGIASEDRPRAEAALRDASARIRRVAQVTWCNTAGGELDFGGYAAWVEDEILSICCAAAGRAVDNPDAVESESIDDYSRKLANSSPDVYLTAAEKLSIMSAARRTGMFTQPTSRGATLETREMCSATDHPGRTDTFLDTVDGEPIVWAGPDGY